MKPRQTRTERDQSVVSSGPAFMGTAVRSTLERARALHGRGEIKEAQRLYQGVLLIEPDNAEALHLLGLAYDSQGDSLRGEPLIARSLRLEKRYAWAFANHGLVLVKLRRYEDALTALQRALRLDAHHAPALVARGNALLGLERYTEAQSAYDRALAITPALAEAWSNRGNVLRALSRPADALISFDRALQIAPHDYATHMNRGHALRDLGLHEQALRSYRLALVVHPHMPELLSLCGMMLLALCRDGKALAYFDQALAITPDDVDILYRSCVALDLTHRYEELLERSSRILSLAPDHAAAWMGRGNALQGLRRHTEATDAYAQALTRDPNLREALNNHGVALRMLERYAEALESVDRGLEKAGASAKILCSRALTLQQLGRYDEALASYEAAVGLEPVDASGWTMRGTALQQLLRQAEALWCYRHVQTLNPNQHNALRDEAFCLLLMGDFEPGWKKYEYRWLDAEAARQRHHVDRPLWSGHEVIAGKVILLHSEQGYGDTLQFCRYAALAEARGATVVLEVPRALKGLLSSLGGVSHLVAVGEPLPAIDLQCPLLSLPLAFGTVLETIPAQMPYLRAEKSRVRMWAQRLQEARPSAKLKVGLAWSGNPTHNNDLSRSIVLAALAPLYSMDATFVSLLPQARERDVSTLAQSRILNFGTDLQDFSDTAALVENLDLVISVDTSAVHLAGALGKPVWVLLARVPDWRWLLDREDSPWYPCARLFRQDKPGDWPAVIERVTQELARWIEQAPRPA